jgi:signal peptidase I
MLKQTAPNRLFFDVVRDTLLSGDAVTVRVLGQSMLPFFRSGSQITLHPIRSEMLRRGEVVLGQTDAGNYVVHRILHCNEEQHTVTLLGDGNIQGTETISCEHIYGYVACGGIHRFLAERWMRMRYYRRYPLAVFRRIFPQR